MKKVYIIPQLEVIELNYAGLLCLSGDLGGIADEPGKARLYDDWEEESDW